MNISGVKQNGESVGEVVSLFSGAGGMDIGFHLAGFETLWANDIDPLATRTFQDLFPKATVVPGNLLDVEIPLYKDVDLVIGGPPCQGFSVAGKMNPNDPRSKHVWNFMGAVSKLSPKGFVMENVKALACNGRWQKLLASLIKEAEKMGYTTKLLLLNSAHFGVPQARERMFLIGLKKGKLAAPQPITKENPKAVKSVLEELPKFGQEGNNGICTAKITPAKNPVLRKSPFAGMLFNGQGRPMNLDMPAPTLPASMGGNRTPIIDMSQLESSSQSSWIEEYHMHLLTGGKPFMEVPEILRRITVEEAAALQTFPRGMKFHGSQSAKFRQIGNAVPPLLAYHVAISIKEAISALS